MQKVFRRTCQKAHHCTPSLLFIAATVIVMQTSFGYVTESKMATSVLLCCTTKLCCSACLLRLLGRRHYLLLHDGRRARNAMAVQSGIDGVARALEEGSSNALSTGSHCCSILTAQLLHQLGELSSQMRTCVSCTNCSLLCSFQHC